MTIFRKYYWTYIASLSAAIRNILWWDRIF